jgi:CRISPR-associated helicase Cas3/CRISPR-associated endonuclease Cas3-HD
VSSLDLVWAKSRARPGDKGGELLTEHLLAARDAARMAHRRIGAIPQMPARFWDLVVLACLFHDAGKIPDGFQHMVGNPEPARPWGQRHEVYSLGFAASALTNIPAGELDWVMLGIAVHHRPLEGDRSLKQLLGTVYRTPDDLAAALGHVDPDAARELHAWLLSTSGAPAAAPPSLDELALAAHRQLSNLIDKWAGDLDADPLLNLTGVLVQGAVTLADHAASAHSGFLMCQPLGAAYPKALAGRLKSQGKHLFPHQERALAVDGHLLLRAPTGTGKTETALLWASRQADQLRHLTGGIPRVFYALPYLASINAMSGRLRRELNSAGRDDDLVGVAHSRAASYYLKLATDSDNCDRPGGPDQDSMLIRAARLAVARNRATRLFREPVRVGTPYQLLRGALAGAAHSGILIDSANSVFILDELHAYEPKRLGMILAMTRLWTRLGSRIAVMSATLPHILAELLATALGEPPALVEPPADWTWPVRHRLHLRPGHLTAPASVAEIRQRLRAGASVLVVANNVADALHLYELLAPEVIAAHDRDAALLLHSRFKNGDRATIEDKILARFEAGKPHRSGLLVATQTVEVSLNVDFDALHTSAAPLEPLIQRFGRVNRLGSRTAPGPVIIHQPSYGPRRGDPSQYADGVYDTEPTRLAWQILTRHDGSALDEKLFGQWLDEVYASAWGQEWQADVEREYRNWDNNWLQFQQPFDNRDNLAGEFDKLFDGAEAILEQDADAYRDLMNMGTMAQGRLLAADLLLPIPAYGKPLGRWDKELGVTVINGDYNAQTGLRKIRGRLAPRYRPGEVL